MDNRLTLVNGRKVTLMRDQDLPDLASAIVSYWNGKVKVSTHTIRGVEVVCFLGAGVNVTVLKEDWEELLPKLFDGTLEPQPFYPTGTAETYVLNVLKTIFVSKYPTD